jgi:arylsulfatase A-like enzyme
VFHTPLLPRFGAGVSAPAQPRPPESPARWGATDVLLAAAGFGLAAGLVEALAHTIRRIAMQRMLFLPPELVWQLPLADMVIFLFVGLLLAAAGMAWRALRNPQVVLGCCAALAVFAALLLSERIHLAAEAGLAAALGIGISRVLAPRAQAIRRRQRVWVPAVAALITLGAVLGMLAGPMLERRRLASLPAAASGRPNILLLVLDTVRAWNLSVYGYGRQTTPLIQAWAARGAVLERALAAAPWTTLSHAVMFTGRHPTELTVGWATRYDGSHTTLAEVLGSAGYATAGFAGNYLHVGRSTGLARGFGHFEDYPLALLPILHTTSMMGRLLAVDRVARLVGRRNMLRRIEGDDVNRSFLDWSAGVGSRPWFAFLNYMDAHGPYLPPESYEMMYQGKADPVRDRYWGRLVQAYGAPPLPPGDLSVMLDAYDGSINYLDRQVDDLLRALGQQGGLANTIVVITSDHGELFGEHGVIAHGNNLYLPVLHVPLIVVAPGRVVEGRRVRAPTSLRDLPATILDLAGVPNPGLPGRSFRPALAGDVSGRDTLFSILDYHRLMPKWPPTPSLKGSMRSVVLDSLHYIRNGDGSEELFHLGQDSWEVRNLAGDPAYREALAAHRAALAALPEPPGRNARIGAGCGRPTCPTSP